MHSLMYCMMLRITNIRNESYSIMVTSLWYTAAIISFQSFDKEQ